MKTSSNFRIFYLLLLMQFYFVNISSGHNHGNSSDENINALARLVESKKLTESFELIQPLNYLYAEKETERIEKGAVYQSDNEIINHIHRNRPTAITLVIPGESGILYELELIKSYIGGDMLNITLKGETDKKIKVSSGVHYRGIIKGHTNSYAAFSFHENKMSGILSEGNGNINVVPLKGASGKMIIFNDKDLKNKEDLVHSHDHDKSMLSNVKNGDPSTTAINTDCKVVKFYYECDYTTYRDFGFDVNAVVGFVTDAFFQVATLYYNIGNANIPGVNSVICEISEISVWTQTDFLLLKYPYTPNGAPFATFHFVSSIIEHTGSNYNGDIALFISTRDDMYPGANSAYSGETGTLGNKYLSHMFCSVTDHVLNNFPAFSISVHVMAHETGHLLGSFHTTDNQWLCGCNPIDIYNSNSYSLSVMMPGPMGGNYPDFSVGFGPAYNNCGSLPTPTECVGGTSSPSYPGQIISQTVFTSPVLSGSSEFIPVNLSFNGTFLQWDAVPGATDYYVQYRMITNDGCTFENQWITIGPVTVNELEIPLNYQPQFPVIPGSNYEWKVSADCSPYSDIGQFSIPDDGCPIPNIWLSSLDITAHSVTLAWEKCQFLSSYDVRFRKVSTLPWISFTTSNNFIRIGDLDIDPYSYSQSYEWQVGDASTNNWSALASFTTLSDVYDFLPLYIDDFHGDCTDNYINRVCLFIPEYHSSCSTNAHDGYNVLNNNPSNFTPLMTQWKPDPMNGYFKVNYTGTNQRGFTTVFIDWNRDGDLTDEGEDAHRFFDEAMTGLATDHIYLPNNFSPGYTLLRVVYANTDVSCVAAYPKHTSNFVCGTPMDYPAEAEDFPIFLYPGILCNSARLAANAEPTFSIYPNPGSEFINISDVIYDQSLPLRFEIFNSLGQSVLKSQLLTLKQTIDIKNLEPGVYSVVVNQELHSPKHGKFIKL